MLLFHRRALQQQLEQAYVALGLAAAAGRAFVLPEVCDVSLPGKGASPEAPGCLAGMVVAGGESQLLALPAGYPCPAATTASLVLLTHQRPRPLFPPAVLLLLPEQRRAAAALPAARQRRGAVPGALPRGRGAAAVGQVCRARGGGRAAARAAARCAAQHGDGGGEGAPLAARPRLGVCWLQAARAGRCLVHAQLSAQHASAGFPVLRCCSRPVDWHGSACFEDDRSRKEFQGLGGPLVLCHCILHCPGPRPCPCCCPLQSKVLVLKPSATILWPACAQPGGDPNQQVSREHGGGQYHRWRCQARATSHRWHVLSSTTRCLPACLAFWDAPGPTVRAAA